MAETAAAGSALIVVHVWHEQGSASGIRARVSARLDVMREVQSAATTDSIEQIGRAVTDVVLEFARRQSA